MPYPGELYNVNFESPAVLAEFLAALHDPGKRWAPVRPERVTRSIVAQISQHQAEDMLAGRSCPTCTVGLLGYGDAVCGRCQAEIAEAEEDEES